MDVNNLVVGKTYKFMIHGYDIEQPNKKKNTIPYNDDHLPHYYIGKFAGKDDKKIFTFTNFRNTNDSNTKIIRIKRFISIKPSIEEVVPTSTSHSKKGGSYSRRFKSHKRTNSTRRIKK